MPGPEDPARTLLVLAHPSLERARLNPAMAEAAQGLPGVTVRDLYELYPDFAVDVGAEQAMLVQHELVVLQFPLFWYAPPSLLKEWIDAVWVRGFAYGRHGAALRGKTLLCAISTGAAAAAFTEAGAYRHTMGEFLRPLEETARYCGLAWAEPFVVHADHAADEAGLRSAVAAYRARLTALTADLGRTPPAET